MEAAARAQLSEGASRLDVQLTEAQLDALSAYVALLLRWNEKLNLTAVTGPAALVDKHLLDSLALVPFVRGARTLVDVGTGPGLPAVVLAIACPGLAVTAVESIQKKITFVRTVSRELSLGLKTECVRLEQWRPPGPFEVAVSRATFEPSEWVERGAGLVEPGGRLLAMLSGQQALPAAPTEFLEEEGASHVIGGAVRRVCCFRRKT